MQRTFPTLSVVFEPGRVIFMGNGSGKKMGEKLAAGACVF
jgi:hypothetical protein